jgi:SAM-dependent methyltransferase
METGTPSVGRHYDGELGEAYYRWQQRGADLGARIDGFKFAPYVGPRDTVLDFGCGGGAMLASLLCARRLGVEPNPAARAAAEARGLEMHATAAEVPGGVADVVMSNHALEHALSPLQELRELHRVLRPGGRLVIWLPLDDWRRQRRAEPGDINHHLYTWTPLLLSNLLDEAGFRVLECRVVARAWPQRHEELFRLLPRRAFDAVARAWAVALRHRQVMAVAERPPA